MVATSNDLASKGWDSFDDERPAMIQDRLVFPLCCAASFLAVETGQCRVIAYIVASIQKMTAFDRATAGCPKSARRVKPECLKAALWYVYWFNTGKMPKNVQLIGTLIGTLMGFAAISPV